jgi:hypothetical protein
MKGVHVPFDAGHFALDTKADAIAALVGNFTATLRPAVSCAPARKVAARFAAQYHRL